VACARPSSDAIGADLRPAPAPRTCRRDRGGANAPQLFAALPADAAKRVFGRIAEPSAGPPRSIGSYAKGCIAGAVPLPADGPNWQVMRPARNRAWGHPVLIAAIEHLAESLPEVNGWPGLLIGDIGQPRGGPMVTGHASHEIGLDADIWLTPMPDRRLSIEERDNLPAHEASSPPTATMSTRAIWNPSYRKALRGGGAHPRAGADVRQPGDQAGVVPRGANSPGNRSRLARQGAAVVGP
jgi:penicillin-insensitive murein endopeptidase